MKATAAVTMILCFIVTFHSSYAITCNQCLSENNSNPECEEISNSAYSKPCEAKYNQCANYKWRQLNGDYALVRDCASSDDLQEYAHTLESITKLGVSFKIFTCDTNDCNIF